jgi:hypothetical protein
MDDQYQTSVEPNVEPNVEPSVNHEVCFKSKLEEVIDEPESATLFTTPSKISFKLTPRIRRF